MGQELPSANIRLGKTPPKVVVVGSINMDLVINCDRIPRPGETIIGQTLQEFGGGKGANQAVAASRMNAAVRMLGAVGDDGFGNQLLENLKSDQVDVSEIDVQPGTPSGTAIINVQSDGENAITVIPGANGRVTPSDIRKNAAVIESADIVMLQLEIPLDAVIESILIARSTKTRVMLDPAPAPSEVPSQLLGVDLICPNESEAESLVGIAVDSIESAKSASKRLHHLGAANVIITLGSRGCFFSDGNTTKHFPSWAIDTVDTTAAGDTFAGTLAAAWMRSGDLQKAIPIACASGALAASRLGAQASIPSLSEVESFLSEQ
ncbi:MAG: ribokinase [Planctomycetota bacterium]